MITLDSNVGELIWLPIGYGESDGMASIYHYHDVTFGMLNPLTSV